jgi:hypothetical protein
MFWINPNITRGISLFRTGAGSDEAKGAKRRGEEHGRAPRAMLRRIFGSGSELFAAKAAASNCRDGQPVQTLAWMDEG